MKHRNFLYLMSIPVILMAGMFVSCGNELNEIREVTVDDDTPQEQMDTVVTVLTDWGEVQLRLTSPRIDKEYGQDPVTHFPEGLYLEFFDTSETVEATLKASRGVIYEQQGRMEVFDNVIFKNLKEDQTMYTEHLVWDKEKEDSSRVYTEKQVRIVKGDNEYWADKGLRATENFDWYELKGFSGKFVLNDSTQTE